MSEISTEERKHRTKAEMKLSEVQNNLDDPTQERVERCQAMLDDVNQVLTETLEDPFLERIATIEDGDELEAAKEEFAGWKTTNQDLYDNLVKILEQFNNDPNPWTLTVSSTGAAAEKKPGCMGTYKKTAQTNNGRLVWKHCDEERFLSYNHSSKSGGMVWGIHQNVDTKFFYIKSKETELDEIPETGWQLAVTDGVEDDDTLEVKATE